MTPLITPFGEGRYEVRWTENGKRRNRIFSTATDACRFHAVRLNEPLAPSVDQVVSRWAAGMPHAHATRRRIEHTRQQLLQPFFGNTPIEAITPEQVVAWVGWLDRERRYSASTIRQHFCVLRSALSWAVDTLIIPVNPCAGVALPRVPKGQRALALTRLNKPPLATRRDPGHQRDCGPLASLRRALSSTASAEEIADYLRRLDIDADFA